jgi:hypothetical protein
MKHKNKKPPKRAMTGDKPVHRCPDCGLQIESRFKLKQHRDVCKGSN